MPEAQRDRRTAVKDETEIGGRLQIGPQALLRNQQNGSVRLEGRVHSNRRFGRAGTCPGRASPKR